MQDWHDAPARDRAHTQAHGGPAPGPTTASNELGEAAERAMKAADDLDGDVIEAIRAELQGHGQPPLSEWEPPHSPRRAP